MPQTVVVFYAEGETAPFLKWMDRLCDRAQDKLIARIELLEAKGHELGRPHSDTLREGVRELRLISGDVNHRVLYFFHGQVAVVSHGTTEKGAVPPREIDLALERKRRYAGAPETYTYREER